MDWRERLRNLWVERMVWTRHYIISLMMGLRDLSFVAARTLRNGSELATALSGFYGEEAGSRIENILTKHDLLLSEVASTIRMGGDSTYTQQRWVGNENELIEFLVNLNPNWDPAYWKGLIQEKFKIEMDLINRLDKNQYQEGIVNFDFAHDNALKIARYMNRRDRAAVKNIVSSTTEVPVAIDNKKMSLRETLGLRMRTIPLSLYRCRCPAEVFT